MRLRSSTFKTGLFLAAGMLAATATPSFGQSVEKPSSSDDIVVAPYTIQRYETARPEGGSILNQEVSRLSRLVSTRGVDFRNDAQVEALRERVEASAREICNELTVANVGQAATSPAECMRETMNDADVQLDRAITRARTYASLK
jgi:UrcA family protein